jgi:hypothetical protein
VTSDANKLMEKYHIKKDDVKHNIDWDAVAESKKAY